MKTLFRISLCSHPEAIMGFVSPDCCCFTSLVLWEMILTVTWWLGTDCCDSSKYKMIHIHSFGSLTHFKHNPCSREQEVHLYLESPYNSCFWTVGGRKEEHLGKLNTHRDNMQASQVKSDQVTNQGRVTDSDSLRHNESQNTWKQQKFSRNF